MVERLNQHLVATAADGSSHTTTSAAIDAARHSRARINPDPVDSSRVHKIQSVALLEPAVLDLFRNDTIVASARRALAKMGLRKRAADRDNNDDDDDASSTSNTMEPLDVFGTKYFPMQPGGTSVSWHQDSHYFGSGGFEAKCLSCAIYLEATSRANGCFRIIPGSHLPTWDCGNDITRSADGLLPHEAGKGRWAHGDWIQGSIPQEQAIDLEVPAGTVVLFDPRVVHAAHANESSTTRASVFGHLVLRSETFVYKKNNIDFTFGKYADRHEIASACHY